MPPGAHSWPAALPPPTSFEATPPTSHRSSAVLPSCRCRWLQPGPLQAFPHSEIFLSCPSDVTPLLQSFSAFPLVQDKVQTRRRVATRSVPPDFCLWGSPAHDRGPGVLRSGSQGSCSLPPGGQAPCAGTLLPAHQDDRLKTATYSWMLLHQQVEGEIFVLFP